jgi:gamma-glutamyltranspeptidase/glutathione hydrolase
VADAHGMTVSMTTTVNQNFGARIAVGGFYLNNVMTNFATEAPPDGVPPANAIAAGKRAKTTIAPLLVLDATGTPIAALGAGGGYRIIGYVANALLRLAGGMRDPRAIVAAPHALNWNGLTEIEPRLGHLERPLTERGHWVTNKRLDGGTQMIVRHGAAWHAAGDPRRDGVGMGVG